MPMVTQLLPHHLFQVTGQPPHWCFHLSHLLYPPPPFTVFPKLQIQYLHLKHLLTTHSTLGMLPVFYMFSLGCRDYQPPLYMRNGEQQLRGTRDKTYVPYNRDLKAKEPAYEAVPRESQWPLLCSSESHLPQKCEAFPASSSWCGSAFSPPTNYPIWQPLVLSSITSFAYIKAQTQPLDPSL